MNTTKFTLYLERDQAEFVGAIASKRRVAPAAVMRWALDHYMETHPDAHLPNRSPECRDAAVNQGEAAGRVVATIAMPGA